MNGCQNNVNGPQHDDVSCDEMHINANACQGMHLR